MLSDADIKEFQSLYEKEFGEKITLDLAKKYAQQLIDLIRAIYKPEQ